MDCFAALAMTIFGDYEILRANNTYRCGSRSKLGMPSGMWWKGCLSTV